MERPEWWEWPLAFTAHVELRMEERGFSDLELRSMLAVATELVPSKRPGRWLVRTRHANRPWVVVLEPAEEDGIVMVVPAYASTTES